MALKQKETTIFRALITQTNPDGSIKVVNGIKQIGGVVQDNIGAALGYVFDESKYDGNYNRKPETMVHDWYNKGESING